MASNIDDLILLERAFLRIGSADTDAQFESLIDKLLIPIIFKVPSNQPGVRNKAVELLTHISKRIKWRPNIQVPIESMLLCYLEATDQFVKNFLVVYVKLGYSRMKPEKQVDHLPLLFKCAVSPGTAEPSKNSLIIQFLKSCKHFTVPELCRTFAINRIHEWDKVAFLLEVFLDTLFLSYPIPQGGPSPQVPAPPESEQIIPPCMSKFSYNRITQDGTFDDLDQIKLGIIRLLASSEFNKEAVFVIFVASVCDSNLNVSNAAEQELKKIQDLVRLTDDELRILYRLFIGEDNIETNPNARKGADLRIKLKLLPHLQRMNVYCWPECIQVVLHCLRKEERNQRLKYSGLTFALSALQKADERCFKEVAPDFLKTLTELLWSGGQDSNVKNMIYLVAGNVINLNPQLVKEYKEIFPKFIEDLTEETSPAIRSTIKDSLLKMADAFRETEEPESLLNFLANRILSPEPYVIIIVMQYLHKIFPADHVKSRFLLVWLASESNNELQKEANGLLYNQVIAAAENKTRDDKVNSRLLPSFAEITAFVHAGSRISSNILESKFIFGDQKLLLTHRVYNGILKYLRMCFLYDYDLSLCAKQLKHPCSDSPALSKYIHRLYEEDQESIDNYLDLINHILLVNTSKEDPLKYLLEFVGLAPDILGKTFSHLYPLYEEKCFTSTEENVRYISAKLYGTSLMYFSDDRAVLRSNVLKLLDGINHIKSKEEERCAWLMTLNSAAERGIFIKIGEIPVIVTHVLVRCMLGNVDSIILHSVKCIGQIGRRSKLPLPNGDIEQASQNGDVEMDQDVFVGQFLEKLTKINIVNKILEFACAEGSSARLKSESWKALGYFCIGEDNFPFRSLICQTLIKTCFKLKDFGLLFDTGIVLSNLIMGVCSSYALDLWTQDENEYLKSHVHKQACITTFDDIMSTIDCYMTKKEYASSKLSAAVWLLVITQKCKRLRFNAERIDNIQNMLLLLITDKQELVQDTIIRALSYIPQYADEDTIDTLAKHLIDALLLASNASSEIPGILNMYKEICILVSTLKNYPLIYQFLNLLNKHDNKTNEKYGVHFEAHEKAAIAELTPHFPKIVTSLYVYKFHPMPKIKSAMNLIWTSLFPENVKTVQKFSSSILQKVIPELTNPRFEMRYAYCQAVEDLLRIEGNKFVWTNRKLMPSLLTQLYKLMDDITESVRKAAYGPTKSYLEAIVRNIVHKKSIAAADNELLNSILPILLETGVSSKVSEVKTLSIKCLLNMVDVLGPMLKPHLSYLIPAMLENAGELDVSKVNELSVRFAGQQQVVTALDNLKEASITSHFSFESIKGCLRYIDLEVLEKLMPRLLELLKDTLSFSARISATNFVILLSQQMDVTELQPFVSKILGALFTGLTNHQENIRRNSASAIGYLCKAAKDSSIDNLLNKLAHLYMKTQDEEMKSAVGKTFKSIAHLNQEAFQMRADKVVPVVFFAMHLKREADGSHDKFIKLWSDVWADLVGSMEAALSKHKLPIIIFLREAVASPSWTVKAQAARSLTVFTSKCQDKLSEMDELKELVNDIIQILDGKFWHGKEDFLETASSFFRNNLFLNETNSKELTNIVLKESAKSNTEYKTRALDSLGKILEISHTDYFSATYDIIKPIIIKETEGNADGDDRDEITANMNQFLKLKETAYSTLGKAWPDNPVTEEKYQEEVITLLSQCLCRSTRLIQLSIMMSLKKIVRKLRIIKKRDLPPNEMAILDRLLTQIEKSIQYALDVKKHKLLRVEALYLLLDMIESTRDAGNEAGFKLFGNVFNEHTEELLRDTDPVAASVINQIKESLKVR